ncbi:MAG TPA: ATP-binding protein [Candidatus Cloacimonadota bacterium]|nr:ATP-binding protein [Candidatus Cloacimonadota bacterium]
MLHDKNRHINRWIIDDIRAHMFKGKAIIILGPRQSGKTTLLKDISASVENQLYLNCDDVNDRQALDTKTVPALRSLVGKHKLILIDEAQRVDDIGICLKIMVDSFPGIQIIATGSSSFELSNRINEPLTGRKVEYRLTPFSYQELTSYHGHWEEEKNLPKRLIWGAYPDIVNNPGQETDLLNLLVGSYLFKDVFMYQDLRRPELLENLLRALALQVGSEVSYTELAQLTRTDHSTVQRYIYMLEQAYIIFRLYNFSANRRNEIKNARKVYFWDNGVRNSLIDDFRQIENRDDIGKLWENYLVSERMKYLTNNRQYRMKHFWRNINQSEIDYLELFNNQITAYEMKWNPKRGISATAFKNAYPKANVMRVDRQNYASFLSDIEDSNH